MYSASAVERCTALSAMDDPQRIPEDDLEIPGGLTGSPVDSATPLVIPANEGAQTIIIDVGGSDNYPNESPVVERLDVDEGVTTNVAQFTVEYQSDESDDWSPLSSSVSAL